jgi:hypothetical protein
VEVDPQDSVDLPVPSCGVSKSGPVGSADVPYVTPEYVGRSWEW